MKKLYLFLYVFLLILMSSLVSALLTDGLDIVYDFQDDPATADLVDKVGTNTSTSDAATLSASGINGNAWDFNGGSDKVILPLSSLDDRPTFSINCWVKPDTFPAGGGAIIHGIRSAVGYTKMTVEPTRGLGFGITTSGSVAEEIKQNIIDTGKWTMVTVSYNGAHMTGYSNGTNISHQAKVGIVDLSTDVVIGASSPAGGAIFFNGLIDECYMWNRAITPSEVSDLYNAGTGYFYPFTVADSSTTQLISPVNSSHNNTLNTWFAFNTTNTTTCNLYTNETGSWAIGNTMAATANTTQSMNYTVSNNIFWNVECDGNWGTNNWTLIVDTTAPTISHSVNTLVWNGTLNGVINFTDETEIFSANITLSNGTQIWGVTNLGLKTYGSVINTTVGTSTYLTARTCDAHTAEEIEPFKDIKYEKEGIKYVETKILWLFDGDSISVYPKYSSDYESPSTYKKKDRYTFSFNKKINPSIETFVVESSYPIIIAAGQNHIGHLITGNHWIDFDNNDVTGYDIVRINSYKVEVTLYGLKDRNIQFNSIGELNCVSEVIPFINILPSASHSPYAETRTSTTFYLNVTTNVTDMNASLHYNGSIYNDTTQNFSVTLTTPSLTNYSLYNFSWIIRYLGTDYNVSGGQQEVSVIVIDNCSNYLSIPTNSTTLNLTLRNITNDAVVAGTINSILYYDTGGVNYNYSLSRPTNQTFCMYPSWGTQTVDINTEYYVSSSTKFSYVENNLYLTNVTTLRDLYLTDETTLVTINVKDNTDTKLIGATVQILKWDIGTGTFKQSSSVNTNFDGKAYTYMNLYNTWYKFIVTYEGEVVLTVDPTIVASTTLTLIVNFDEDFYQENIISEGVYSDLTFTNASLYFSYTWTETNATVTQGCLEVYEYTLNGNTLLNNTCSAGASGTIITAITDVQDKTFVANSYAELNNNTIMTDTLSVSFASNWAVFGAEGIFIALLIIISLAFVGLWNPAVAIILTVVGVIATNIMGIININVVWITTAVILAIITIVRINRP